MRKFLFLASFLVIAVSGGGARADTVFLEGPPGNATATRSYVVREGMGLAVFFNTQALLPIRLDVWKDGQRIGANIQGWQNFSQDFNFGPGAYMVGFVSGAETCIQLNLATNLGPVRR